MKLVGVLVLRQLCSDRSVSHQAVRFGYIFASKINIWMCAVEEGRQEQFPSGSLLS
jgi:hypothetical protein